MAASVDFSFELESEQAVITLKGVEERLGTAFDSWLIDSAELAKGWIARKAPEGVTGDLARSVDITYDKAAKSALVHPSAPYAWYVEKGTAPHMPPVDAITPWAEMHGLNPWAVAMGIKKNGTKAHPFFQPAVEEVAPVIMARAEAAFIGAVKV